MRLNDGNVVAWKDYCGTVEWFTTAEKGKNSFGVNVLRASHQLVPTLTFVGGSRWLTLLD